MGYEIEPSVEIHSSPEFIWEQLIDIESWWVASNDEHISLNIESDDKQLKTGTEITVRERIAGIPCCAEGAVTEIKTNRLVVWEADHHLFGWNWLKVQAGVRWKISEKEPGAASLMANVWAVFPDRIFHRLIFFLFKAFGGIEKDYLHAMKELEFLKNRIERKI